MNFKFTHGQVVEMKDYLLRKQINTEKTTVKELFLLYYNNNGSLLDISITGLKCSFQDSDIQQGWSGKIYSMTPEEKEKEDAGFFRAFKLVPLSKMRTYLTNGGNLLRFYLIFNKWYFQKPDGEFIREVSDSEGEYLSQQCLQIEIKDDIAHPEFLPTWHFIKSVQVTQDDSNYRWETCNNGGNYSFQKYHNWFVAKYPDGEWKFAYVETHYTSAEFSYDELTGTFQQELGNLFVSNVEEGKCYHSQIGVEWVDGEKEYFSYEVLEKIATIGTFEKLWKEQYLYCPSMFDNEEYEKPEFSDALTISDKKEIVKTLRNLGVDLRQGYRRHRGGFKKSNRR